MKEGYALCLNKWALDKSINGELGLLLIISSLCAEKGYCYASNEYLAQIFNEHTTTISRKIKKLKELGYITIEYEKRGAEIKKRFLRLANLLTDDYQNCYSTISKVAKENNISINNTSINNKEIYKEIIDYLNITTNKHYKHTDSTIKLIKARLNEGFTVSDFKNVIDKKTKDWGEDQRMKDYLRPQTLFSNKFEGYLNQEEKRKSGFMGYMEEFYGKENNS